VKGPDGSTFEAADLPSAREIAELDRLAGLLALVGPIEDEARRVLTAWQPLLLACKKGETAAPRHALRTELARAEALAAALEAQPASEIRDASLACARATVEMVGKWLPARRGSHLQSVAYDGPIAGSTPGSVVPTGPSDESDGSTIRVKRLVQIAVLLAVVSLAAWIVPILLEKQPQPVEEDIYLQAVEAIEAKDLRGSTLVLTMKRGWGKKDVRLQLDDIMAAMEVAGPEPYTQMMVEEPPGRTLAWVHPDGKIEWTATAKGSAR
jgi:hypothetical protein